MESTPFISAHNLCRHYQRGSYVVKALDDVNLTIDKGEFVGVVGASGSGKSTLLNLLAGLDSPTAGHVAFGGDSLSGWSRRQLAAYRASRVGMVFQSFNLIGHNTALQDVETALLFNDTPRNERRQRATAILEKIGLGDRLGHRPADLSGGEQQRVALARAIVKQPEILFADEPTGNLDLENSRRIAEMLTELNREGLTVVLVTHNLELAQRHAGRIVRMYYGRIEGEVL